MKLVRLLVCALLLIFHAPVVDAQDDTFSPLRFGDPLKLSYDAAFFPGAHYDPQVPTTESLVGRKAGDRLAHHGEIVRCFEAWAEASPRVELGSHGQTHEGRELIHAVVSSPKNLAQLDRILADHQRLDDPRGQAPDALDQLTESLPAVAWMGYSIHGDEVSGCDAALALCYHLAACTDEEVTQMLEDLVIIIDPVLNPDGRERIIGMVEQAAGRAPVLDHSSMHRGRWPYGRGNHYLFDMNRDWMAGTQPETRARWSIARKFHPQLFVDAHEMEALESFLFYPQATPINPFLPPGLVNWQRRYAEGAANAFDRAGWSYYTREWADGWAPFYSDSWGSLLGATGMLYEQASSRGLPVRKASGRIERYRETVHHQLSASWANLLTLQANRSAALRDQLAFARASVSTEAAGNGRAFVYTPSGNEGRETRFLDILLGQGIEVFLVPDGGLTVHGVNRWNGTHLDSLELPAGSLVVPSAQPRSAMVKAFLSFDVRMDDAALQREREALERTGDSKIYDLTAWSLPLSFGLNSAWVDAPLTKLDAVESYQPVRATLISHGASLQSCVGWVVDGHDDNSIAFAVQAMEAGLIVHVTDEPFRINETSFDRGSLLISTSENRNEREALEHRLLGMAQSSGLIQLHRAPTGLADVTDPHTGEVDPDEPDFGGGHFHQLARPKVSILANAPVQPDVFGHLWWWLDHEFGISATQLDVQSMWAYDLRRFNVLVAPPGALRESMVEDLDAWVNAGGTLIAVGDSAAAATAGALGLSEVSLRTDALEELDSFNTSVDREIAARHVTINSIELWGETSPTQGDTSTPEVTKKSSQDDGAEPEVPTQEEEDWARRFAPFGASLRAFADPEHWLTAGVSSQGAEQIPVHVNGPNVFLSKGDVETPIRLMEADRLRLSGLLWPEARERLALSAWATVESHGHGQVILFADVPGYRGDHALTARLFGNAVVYGPALGSDQPIPR